MTLYDRGVCSGGIGGKAVLKILLPMVLTFVLLTGFAYAGGTLSRETLAKYEAVISKTNELTLYGYDLKHVTLKLKIMTDHLLGGRNAQALQVLDEIRADLERIEKRGPEALRRERELVWLEIYGDFVRQLALFALLTFLILRFPVVKRRIADPRIARGKDAWKVAGIFIGTAFFAGTLSFVRYDQSSWAFIDLQILLVSAAGLLGGLWVGLISGISLAVLRYLAVPEISALIFAPAWAGLFGACLGRLERVRPVRVRTSAWVGGLIFLFNNGMVYRPMWHYLPGEVFVLSVLALTVTEASIFTLFFAVLGQIYRDEKAKETERELFSTQLQFLRAQINPHFLFNALNTIASVCGEENAEKARSLIIQLSALLRRLSRKQGDYVTLAEELEHIDHYLEIEKARFSDKLSVEKEICLSEKELQTALPILILQPVVENAVKHGISKKAEGGTIRLKVGEAAGKIRVEVTDSGAGMGEETLAALLEGRPARYDQQAHAGIGLQNIRERLKKLYGDTGRLDVRSRPGEGTTVTIEIPREP
jgi:LytS/YehU family sensor histidine kinase